MQVFQIPRSCTNCSSIGRRAQVSSTPYSRIVEWSERCSKVRISRGGYVKGGWKEEAKVRGNKRQDKESWKKESGDSKVLGQRGGWLSKKRRLVKKKKKRNRGRGNKKERNEMRKSSRRRKRRKRISSGLSREWDRDRRKRRKEKRGKHFRRQLSVSRKPAGTWEICAVIGPCIVYQRKNRTAEISNRFSSKQITLFPTFLPCSEEYSPGEKNWFHFGLDRDKRCNEEYFILEINLKGKGKRSDCWLPCNIG